MDRRRPRSHDRFRARAVPPPRTDSPPVGHRRWGVVAPLAVALLAAVLLAAPVRAAGAEPLAITEFPAFPASNPTAIAPGPDGNLWFIEVFRAALGRITPTGAVTEFSEGITPMPPASMGGLLDVTAGPDGNVWFTEGQRDIVGRITPSGTVTEFSQGITPGSFTLSITAGPDGNLWFTEGTANRVGRITPSGAVTEFPLGPTPQYGWGSGVGDIAAGPDGNVWFTGLGGVGRITPAGVVTAFPLDVSARALTAGPDGNLWFRVDGTVSGLGAGIGRITTSGSVRVFPVPFVMAGGDGLTVGSDGNLWFIAQDAIGRMTPSGAVTRFTEGIRPGSGLRDITAGPDGKLWFTLQYDNRIGRFAPPPPEAAPAETPTPSSAGAPTPPAARPLALAIAGPGTVRRGGRALFVYRVRNRAATRATGVVLVNTLPRGLGIDAASRRANQRARRALRFTGSHRTATFRIGTIRAGATVTVRVDAAIARSARPGRTVNTLVVRATGLPAGRAISRVTIR